MYNAAGNIEEYIAQAQDSQLLRQVLHMVHSTFPEEELRYFDNGKTFSAIALGQNPYPSPGYEEAGTVNISSQKNYVAIYFYGENISWQNNFPKSAMGKGCLRIKSSKFMEKYDVEIREFFQNVKLYKPHDKRN
ncbi:DUF1801 domain-containing protein [Lactococcus muris]|uniref:DUF1801 domain-containing protein n=1 Tax=Lactococcus muris TaxID=2941330 RepID=A0ABV4D9N0_9LACT|nr:MULTISPECIES: DUF1801 domain-containing protein [Lactococcus]